MLMGAIAFVLMGFGLWVVFDLLNLAEAYQGLSGPVKFIADIGTLIAILVAWLLLTALLKEVFNKDR